MICCHHLDIPFYLQVQAPHAPEGNIQLQHPERHPTPTEEQVDSAVASRLHAISAHLCKNLHSGIPHMAPAYGHPLNTLLNTY